MRVAIFVASIALSTRVVALESSCLDGQCKQKVAIVTGSNRGIGMEVVSGLLSKLDEPYVVYLASRNSARGDAAMKCLRERHFGEGSGNTCCSGTNAGSQPCHSGSEFYKDQMHKGTRLEFQELDLADPQSVNLFAKHIRDEHGRVDILVNNACAPGKATPREHIAVDIIGHQLLMDSLSPLVQDNARIVMVGSMAGSLGNGYSSERKAQLRSDELTIPLLHELMNDYVLAAEARKTASEGWPSYGYAVAKAGTIAMARVLSRQPTWNASGVLINSCCPGMANAPYCQQGAHTIIQLAMLPTGQTAPNGAFFQDPSFSGTIKESMW